MHKNYMKIKMKSEKLSKESKKREMAMEILQSYNDKSLFYEIR